MRGKENNIHAGISEDRRESRRELLVRKIKGFRLLDDDFMSRVFEDNIECTELLLHIIMNRDDIKVQEVHTQYSIKNLHGRSVRLDIFATDSSDRKYNFEIQRSDKGAGVKRARYNSSIIDANILDAGMEVEELPETYVIFITENDVMRDSRAVYHVSRVVAETGQSFGDGTHILYVNGRWRDDTPIGKLMYDFSCTNPDDMHYAKLADRVRYFKEDEEGVAAMCRAVEELCDEARNEGHAEGKNEEKLENAAKLLRQGKLTREEISEVLGIDTEIVDKIAESLG